MKLNFNSVTDSAMAGAVGTGITIGTDKLIGMLDTEGKIDGTLRAVMPALAPVALSLVAPKLLKNKTVKAGADAAVAIAVFRVANSLLPSDYRVAGPFDGHIAGNQWQYATEYAESNPANKNVMV